MIGTITVVIPAYNQGRFLGKSLNSVLAQTRQADEIIVIDDASQDNTQEIITRLKKNLSPQNLKKIKTFRQKNNLGPTLTWNAGFKAASGDYIIFLPADDWFSTTILEEEAAILDKNPKIAVVYSQAISVINGKEKLILAEPAGKKTVIGRHEYSRLLTKGDFIIFSTAMVRLSICKNLGYFDTNLRFRQDYEYWIRLAKLYPFAYIAKPLAYFRLHKTNYHLNPQFRDSYEVEINYIFKKHLKNNSALKNDAYRNYFIQLSLLDLSKGNYKRSLILFLKSLKTRPSSIMSFNSFVYPYHILKNIIKNSPKKLSVSEPGASVKLILGCGPLPMHPEHYKWIDDTWIFTDLYPTDKKIVKLDARKISYPNASIDALYASHLLEHISHLDTQKTLNEWYRVLKSHGKLLINVPDLEWACEKFLANYQKGKPTGSNAYLSYKDLLLVFYGHQYDEGEYHKTGFTQKSLKKALINSKFKNITVEKTFDGHQIGVLIATAYKLPRPERPRLGPQSSLDSRRGPQESLYRLSSSPSSLHERADTPTLGSMYSLSGIHPRTKSPRGSASEYK